MKSELSKLSSHSTNFIEFDSGLVRQNLGVQSLVNSSLSASNSSSNLKSGKIFLSNTVFDFDTNFICILIHLVDVTIPDENGCVTYEQMMIFIEQYLQETDYYKDVMCISSTESIATNIQRNQRPPSGKR